jgi:hypothetical protein
MSSSSRLLCRLSLASSSTFRGAAIVAECTTPDGTLLVLLVLVLVLLVLVLVLGVPSSPSGCDGSVRSDARRALARGESFRGHRREDPFLVPPSGPPPLSSERGEAPGEDDERGERRGCSAEWWSSEEEEEEEDGDVDEGDGDEREEADGLPPRDRGERGLPSSPLPPRTDLSGLEEKRWRGGLKNSSAMRVLRRAGFCTAERDSFVSGGDRDADRGRVVGQVPNNCLVWRWMGGTRTEVTGGLLLGERRGTTADSC